MSSSYQRLGYASEDDLISELVRLSDDSSTVRIQSSRFERSSVRTSVSDTSTDETTAIMSMATQFRFYNSMPTLETRSPTPISQRPTQLTSADLETGVDLGEDNESLCLQNDAVVTDCIADLLARSGEVAEESDETCIICYSFAADMCFMDCGHGGFCRACATTLARKPQHSCPICRGVIKHLARVNSEFFWLKKDVGVFISDEGFDVMSPLAVSGTSDDDGV